ncbi:glucoamylase family protein [Persicobacter diffluens]|uniref:Glycoamylase-like domain-containing protein n=1 Tax=Persicobacter diffluens TaxID=981 RepID=A0AAN5AKB2_9BACT|nr:hypothetical protein PEDI_32170 [Persicobacter diffluens]
MRFFYYLIVLFFSLSACQQLGKTPFLCQIVGYDQHIELSWQAKAGAQYEVFESVAGQEHFLVKTDFPFYLDFVGTSKSRNYRIYELDDKSRRLVFEGEGESRDFSDEELLDMVQRYTFRYFWEGAHPQSGMVLERFKDHLKGNIAASGATGFGLMAIPVGIERGFISREEGAERVLKILNFLKKADRFHGVWPHWMHAETGQARPFDEKDDGGDLVESSHLLAGMEAVKSYFLEAREAEGDIRVLAQELIDGVEWDWYVKESPYLRWHWSPNFKFEGSQRIEGYNQTLMTYMLAIGMKNEIGSAYFKEGWTNVNNNHFLNGREYYGMYLPMGNPNYGGAIINSIHSHFLINPFGLQWEEISFEEQVVNQAKINFAYCVDNPKSHSGYSKDCWGIGPADNPWGYEMHHPGPKDNGTIAPSAALGIFPYTPEESMRALKHFYRERGKELFGYYGFHDSFNDNAQWVADTYVGNSKAATLLMIENYRSGLLWKLGGNSALIQNGLKFSGFRYEAGES